MKKFFTILSSVTIMAVLLVTPAYAMGGRGCSQRGYYAPMNTYLNYGTATNNLADNVDSLVTTRKAYLDSLVEQGVITQDYADAEIDNYRAMLEYCATNGGFCGGFGGGFGGFYGDFGGGFGGCCGM